MVAKLALVSTGALLLTLTYIQLRNHSPPADNIQVVQLPRPKHLPDYNKSSQTLNPTRDIRRKDDSRYSTTEGGKYLTIYPLDGSAGRLGNFCFRYASAQGIAINNNRVLVLPDTPLVRTMKTYFNLQAPLSSDIENWEQLTFTNISEKHWGIYGKELTKDLPSLGDIRLYWTYTQSWKYFYNIRDSIRKELTFPRSLSDEASGTLTELKSRYNVTTAIGLHVRRGDFLKPSFANWGYSIAPADYFTSATKWFVEKYGTNILFVVAAQAEDIPWSRQNLEFIGAQSYFSTEKSAIEDFAMLVACDHHIVSVGSYGWWAAWLGKGDTVYYKLWPRPGSNHAKNHSPTDYYPPEWIPLP